MPHLSGSETRSRKGRRGRAHRSGGSTSGRNTECPLYPVTARLGPLHCLSLGADTSPLPHCSHGEKTKTAGGKALLKTRLSTNEEPGIPQTRAVSCDLELKIRSCHRQRGSLGRGCWSLGLVSVEGKRKGGVFERYYSGRAEEG